MHEPPTQQEIQALLDYDSVTGVFKWRVNGRRARAGAIAGCFDKKGYRVIKIKGRQYRAHRLAWLYVHGVWPSNEIDHWNRVKDDNRIDNLRDVPNAVNGRNRVNANSNSSTGLLGAHRRGNRFSSSITVNRVMRQLGVFDTAQEAHDAYMQAKSALL